MKKQRTAQIGALPHSGGFVPGVRLDGELYVFLNAVQPTQALALAFAQRKAGSLAR